VDKFWDFLTYFFGFIGVALVLVIIFVRAGQYGREPGGVQAGRIIEAGGMAAERIIAAATGVPLEG